MIPKRTGKDPLTRRWTQDIKETLGMAMLETVKVQTDREPFQRAVTTVTFFKGLAAR